MLFARREKRAKTARSGFGLGVRLEHVVLSISFIVSFAGLLPTWAWAGSPNFEKAKVTTIEIGTAPSVMLARAIPISDTEPTKQMAGDLSEPTPSVEEAVPRPRVILWDEIGQPGRPARAGDSSTTITVTNGH
jgi:hypothetical protein